MCALILLTVITPATLCSKEYADIYAGGGGGNNGDVPGNRPNKSSGGGSSSGADDNYGAENFNAGKVGDTARGGASVVLRIASALARILRYAGIILLAISVGMLVLAFKNEDPEGKIRYSGVIVVSVFLIFLPSVINSIVAGIKP